MTETPWLSVVESAANQASDINGHIWFMWDLAVQADAKQVVELGVRSGVSTVAWVAAMHATGGQVWSCDIDKPSGVRPEVALSERWTFVQGDDLTVEDVPTPDILFIDTSHHYAHTRAELDRFGPMTRHTIVLHDTEVAVPYMAPPEDPQFPVLAAIVEWMKDNPGWSFENFAHCNGLGVLRRQT